MKRLVNKTKGLIRGTSTSVLLSVVIHAAFFFGAGVWVVFKFIDAQVAKFVPPPPVERPKMQLKKLRVKVKPSTKPRKTTQRITSTRKTGVVPDIQLPEMTGMGAGLEDSIGGFEMLTDLSAMTMFGGGKSMGNDLEGTFYHFMRDRSGIQIPGMRPAYGANPPRFYKAVEQFLNNGWSPTAFSPYYRAPAKLYATHIMIPPRSSALGPDSFGIEENIEAALWVIHYKGKIAHPKGGKFRFLGMADDLLMVRMDGKLILDANIPSHSRHLNMEWKSSSDEHQKYRLGPGGALVGDWFTLLPGQPADVEILVSEVPGGWFFAMLLIQEFGVDYPKNKYDAPILPIFKTMEFPEHIIEEIKYGLIPGDASLDGPVFSVY